MKLEWTEQTRDLFVAIVKDAGNWSGTPPCYNHINAFKRGNLTDLKKRGLVTTFESDGEEWIQITLKGYALADVLGLHAWIGAEQCV